MSRYGTRRAVKISLVLAVIPVLIYAYASDPDPFLTGDPADGGATCILCHRGPPENGGGGNIQITLSNGNTYVPGQTQQISVTISDAAQRVWGFELTARVLADNTQTGDLNPVDSSTVVICSANPRDVPGQIKGTSGCPASRNFQFIEHAEAKYGPGSGTFTFKWTPPATAVGTIVLYAAGNAANGDGNDTGDHIYTTSVQLTPTTASNAPTINTNGVVPIYSTSTNIESGSWISIYGNNLASATTVWNGDFPTSLGGVNVSIDNKPAFIWFVSPGQINVQAPDDSNTGTVLVVVTNGSGTASSTATLQQFGPTFSVLDGTHVAGIVLSPNGLGAYGGGTYDVVGPGNLGFNTRPANKGDVVELFGTGFGPTNPTVPAGKPLSISAPKTVQQVTITIGNVSQTVDAYIVGAGLYQMNVTIPLTVASGDLALRATAGGAQTPSTVVISVQ
jgi:uncharacterized protein (TIGR03437 family)